MSAREHDAACLILALPSRPDLLGMVREVTFELARLAQLEPAAAEQVALAVTEAATNVIEHAYGSGEGSLELRYCQTGTELRIELIDEGRAVEPAAVPTVDLERYRQERRKGGLGLHLMARIMDSVTYVRRGSRNVCCLVKRLPGGGGAPGA